MIPKIIHYCWFGKNPLPPLAIKCINSWKKYFPDYEIREWNENNFDVNIIPYTKEAYNVKKYAFVSDYARFWILYNYGGLYFDTDVEVIKPMDDIIANGAFMGCENEVKKKNHKTLSINPGLGIGAKSGLNIYQEILNLYATLHFIRKDGSYNQKTIVYYTTEILCKYGLKQIDEVQNCAGILIYPKEYFSPKNYKTGELAITNKSYTIHHYSASWKNDIERYADQMKNKLLFIPPNARIYIGLFIATVKYKGFLQAFQAFIHSMLKHISII